MDPARLRVAIVADAAPGRNGVGTYYADLAEHLAPEVARVALYAPGLCAGAVVSWPRLPLPGDA